MAIPYHPPNKRITKSSTSTNSTAAAAIAAGEPAEK